MLSSLRSLNLLLAFLLELCLLVTVGYWGWYVGDGAFKIILAIVAPLLVAVFWGLLLAPKAIVHISQTRRTLLITAVFALGVAALFGSAQPVLAVALGVVFVINRLLLTMWHQ